MDSNDAERGRRRARLGAHDSRLSEPNAPELVEALYRPRLERHKPMFGALMRYNLAHVVMMAEESILPREEAAALLGALRSIEDAGVSALPLDPANEDIFPNVEAALIDRLGEAVGGKILTGRSRADAQYTPDRMILRDRTLDILEEAARLREVLLERASEHAATVMPTHTNLQTAQPGTFGHYLVSYAEALEADSDRLAASHSRLCLSPAEIGVNVGGTFPLNRERVAALLGFDVLLENARRALNSTDIEAETVCHIAILLTHLSRLSEDLYIFSSQEFGLVELADRYSSTSFMMPQKKNPKGLDPAKFAAVAALGNLNCIFNLFRFAPAAHHQYAASPSPLACETAAEALAALRVMRGVMETLIVHEERMRQRAGRHFAQATDLADALVRERGFSFRAAHRSVGAAVRRALAAGLSAGDLTAGLLDAGAREATGGPAGLPPERIGEILDPERGARARSGVGGTAPEAVAASIERRRSALKVTRERLSERRARRERAESALREAVSEYLGEGRPLSPPKSDRPSGRR